MPLSLGKISVSIGCAVYNNLTFNRTDMESDFSELVETLREKCIVAPRVLVYCQSLDMCAELYAHFHHNLQEASYYPPDSEHISDHRLFGMYHANTCQHNKDVILNSLADPNGVVRVVFATVALGMGINLRDINVVIHYGSPQSLEDYFQESGRGGRSGDNAVSTIFWKPIDCLVKKQPITLRDHELITVRRYLTNMTGCRRKWLLEYFDTQISTDVPHCCDICSNFASNPHT